MLHRADNLEGGLGAGSKQDTTHVLKDVSHVPQMGGEYSNCTSWEIVRHRSCCCWCATVAFGVCCSNASVSIHMKNAQVAGVSASEGRARRGSSSPRCSLGLTRDLAAIIARAFLTSGCYAKSEEHNTGRLSHDTSWSAAELLFPFLTEGGNMAFSHVLMVSRSPRCCKLTKLSTCSRIV